MEQKPIKSVLAYVDSLKPVGVAMAPAVKNQCIEKFTKMYPALGKDYAARYYERESDAFTKMVMQSDALRQCTPRSIYFAFMKGMALKLSFDNGRQPQLYLIPGKRNIGTKENPNWIQEVSCQPSPDGEKEVRISNGIIKEVGHPYIVHKGDVYKEKFNLQTGEMEVTEFEPLGKSSEIIGSFMRLVNPDGKVVYKTFKPVDWKRWEAASAKKNYGKTNPLYTSGVDGQIDEAFLKGKTTLHAFKGYKQVDYIYDNPKGFEPDKEAAAELNPNYMDDVYDDAVIVEDDKPEQQPDELSEAIQEAKEEVKPSVKVETTGDDDDLFNN